MAKGICPILSDPTVKQEFEELVEVLGERQAYAVWDQNGGYSLDKAPNGEPSILFDSLLEYYNKNRVAALQAKAKVYTISFQERIKETTHVMDSNGEFIFNTPLSNIFDMESSPLQQTTEQHIDDAMAKFRKDRFNFDSTLDSLRQLVTNAVEARIKSIQNRKIQNKTALLVPLEQQLAALKNPNISALQTIIYCLYDINRTMTAPVNAVLQAQKNLRQGKDSGFSNLALIQLQQDYFGMYNRVLEDIAKNVFDSSLYADILGKDKFDELQTMIKSMRIQFAAARQGITELTTDLAQKTLLQYGGQDPMSRTELEDYVSSELITAENDSNSLMRLIGSGDKMNDKASRVIFNMVTNANNQVRFATHKFGNKMLRLQEQISLGEQMRLFEYDSDGKKTGFFIRDKKYGMFMNDLDIEKTRLKTKYKVPEEQQLPIDKADRIKFNKEINDWLNEHCERRYTQKYYDAFNGLSQEAKDAREAIQFKIYKLLDDVRDNKGKVNLQDLTEAQWVQYQDYGTQKKQLLSKYYEDGSPKTDMDLDIANELSYLNKTLHEGMHYVTNKAKFEEAKKEAKENLTKEQYVEWKKRYTRQEIDEKFYKQLADLEKKTYGPRYNELKEIRDNLTKPYRNEYTGGVDVKRMSSKLLGTLRSIDREMRKERKNTPKTKKTEAAVTFEDIAESVPTEQYKKDRQEALKRGIEFLEAWESTHTTVYYKNEQEVRVPNWYYTKIVPKDKTLINDEAPTREFSEIDPKSEYFNNKFDQTVDEYYQPKESIYKNSDYYIIFKPKKDKDGNDIATANIPLWNLYKGLIKGMEQSNDKITYLTRNNPYRLPQMSGSMYQHMQGDGVIKGFLEKTSQGLVKDTDDVGFVDRPTSRPDGSEQRMIPTYYINKLENGPQTITNDIVGAVIAYFKMAENFKQKTEIQPDLEVIKMQLANRTYTGKPIGVDSFGKKVYKQSNQKEGKNTKTYQFVSKFLDMHEYGEETNALIKKIGKDNRIAKAIGLNGKELNFSKVLAGIKNFGQLIGLGLNLAVGTTSGVTAFASQTGFAANGRYFDFSSLAKSYATMISNLFGIVHYMKGKTTNNKYVFLMQRFEVGTEFANSYRNSNRVGVINTIANNWAFGLFSLSDFIIKGTLLNSIMNNYRYYNGRFYNKQQFINVIGSKTDADNIWRSLKSTYDIIKIDNGELLFENKKYEQAFKEVENQISNSSRSLAATIDGQLTSEQKTQLSANAFGSLVTMFRNYIPGLINDRVLMKKQYDYNTGMTREALYRTLFRVIPMLIKDWNTRKQLDSSDIGNLKQVGYELSMIVMLQMVLKPILVDMADDDKDDWVINFLALLVTRSGFEYANQYNAIDLLNTLTSVSSITDILKPFTNLVLPFNSIPILFNDKKIKYGAYEGSTQFERMLWKMTPFKNIKEIQDPAMKRKYYEQLYK